MNRGRLYGIGAGPGDPEWLTLKAVRYLKQADIIAVPDAGNESFTALSIVSAHIEGKPILHCPAPMTRDREALEAAWQTGAELIRQELDKGHTVAFVTLGDPSVYSTYSYLHRRITALGYEAEVVPGVPSFCAAAAKLGIPLCEGEERLMIIPAGDGEDAPCSRVYMKAGRNLARLKEELRQSGDLGRSALAVNCGLPGEKLYPEFAGADETPGYFAVVLVKN